MSIQERIENGFTKINEEIAALNFELKNYIKSVREELNEATKILNAAWEEVSSLEEKNKILQQQLDSTAEENVKLKEDFEALRVRIVKQEDFLSQKTTPGEKIFASMIFQKAAMWLGQWKNRRDTPFSFNWPVDPICALGVFFSYDAAKAAKLNFDEKLRSMEKILNIWKNRKLTLIGRINIVKTLALSKLIFNSSNLS